MPERMLIQRLVQAYLDEPQLIGVNTLRSLAPRSDGQDIFIEGSQFSGVVQKGAAESCVTIVPAPHIQPSVSRSIFLSEASKAFDHPVELPKSVNDVDFFSPQVIVWFRNGELPSEPFDFESLYQTPENQRKHYYDAISLSAQKALNFVSGIHQVPPTMWGIWGYGTPDERITSGETRGGPTMKQGHFHVSAYDINEQNLTIESLPVKKRLEHTAPWITLIQEKMGAEISKFLTTEINSLGYLTEINLLDRRNKLHDGLVGRERGFNVHFNTSVSLPDLFRVLTCVAGSSDHVYQSIKKIWLDYYRHFGSDPDWHAEESILQNYLSTLGVDPNKVTDIAEFIFMIQPTYGQLQELKESTDDSSKEWIEKRMKKYNLFRKKIESGEIPRKVMSELIYDATKDPSEMNTITLTFPVHASFCFMVENIRFENGQYQIDDIKLFPDITTSEAATERVFGSVLKRSLV